MRFSVARPSTVAERAKACFTVDPVPRLVPPAQPCAGAVGRHSSSVSVLSRRPPEVAVAWVAAVLLFVITVFWQNTWAMIEIWKRSDSYAHGFLVVPVFLGWVWVRRTSLSLLPVKPFWPGLFCLVCLGLAWLLADWVAAAAPSQLAVVAFVPMAIATVLGTAWIRALMLPFAFLFFAVPAGDALVPQLIDWTADFTVAALALSGVPVYRENAHFSIPSGHWSVVEACSGIRYLIACAAVGTVYAAAIYRSWRRRLAFVAGAVLCALIANWIRAYGIVMLAHLTNNRLAAGVDHLIYGWLFFAVIVFVLFAIGARWREDAEPAQATHHRQVAESGARTLAHSRQAVAATAVAACIIGLWPVASRLGSLTQDVPVTAANIQSVAGWTSVSTPVTSWRPHLKNPSIERIQTLEKDGARVSVYLGIYRGQTRNAKLVSSVNQLAPSSDPRRKQVGRGTATQMIRGARVDVNVGTIASAEDRIVAWQWYWTNGVSTGSRFHAALDQARVRLTGRQGTSAWVTVYARQGEGSDAGSRVLEAFMRDMSDSIDEALSATATPR